MKKHKEAIIMSKDTGHKRIAIMVGAGYIPGINAVVAGASLAAGKLGWELVGILDGFEGLLHPEKYPDGGLIADRSAGIEFRSEYKQCAWPVGPDRSVQCPHHQ